MSKLDIPKAHLLGVKSSSGGHFDGQNFLKGFPKILPSAKERKVTLMHFEGVLLARGTDINQGVCTIKKSSRENRSANLKYALLVFQVSKFKNHAC